MRHFSISISRILSAFLEILEQKTAFWKIWSTHTKLMLISKWTVLFFPPIKICTYLLITKAALAHSSGTWNYLNWLILFSTYEYSLKKMFVHPIQCNKNTTWRWRKERENNSQVEQRAVWLKQKVHFFVLSLKIYIYYVGSIEFQESLIIHFLAFKCEGFANDVVSKYIVVT